MQALVARNYGELALETVPDPTIGVDDVLIRTKVSAVSSGTEQRMLYGRPGDVREQAPDFPVVGAFGYLAAGEVIEVGQNVEDVSPGDRVSCGRVWGAHRSMLDTDAGSVLRIPDDMSYLEAAASYWAVPPMAGILAGRPRFYSDTAVIGLGPLGLCAVQMLLMTSRRVAAVDIVASRVRAAEALGAIAVDGTAGDPIEAVSKAISGGPEIVVEASGTQAGLQLALDIVRPRGRVALVGVPPPLTDMDLFWPMQIKGVQLVPLHRESAASPQGGGIGSPRRTYLPDVLDMITRGRLDIGGLTSWVVPPTSGPDAMDLLHNHPDLVLGTAFAWDEAETRNVAGFEQTLAETRAS